MTHAPANQPANLRRRRAAAAVTCVLGLAVAVGAEGAMADGGMVARGRYLAEAAACAGCHTKPGRADLPFAGGRAMSTPFGTFYTPNITPDLETGIGGWTDDDFVRAVTEGTSPDGRDYYPVLPYRWYRGMTRDDVLAIKAYLDSVRAIRQPNRDHELLFPASIRPLVWFWKLLNMRDDPAPDLGTLTEEERRGSYLVNAVAHCGACHTGRDVAGNVIPGQYLAGNWLVPGEYEASNITQAPRAGIGLWSDEDLERALAIGMRPDGTPLRGTMAEAVADSTSRLTSADRAAIVAYLRRVPPEDNRIERKPEARSPPTFVERHLTRRIYEVPELVEGRAIVMGAGGAAIACLRCHDGPAADQSGGVLPRLAGQSAAYLERQLELFAKGERRSAVMEPIAGRLDRKQRRAVAAYYGILPPPFEPPPLMAPAPRDPTARGEVLARQGDPAIGVRACITCHDAGGTGFAPAFPYLAGQRAAYMEVQFAQWRRELRRGDPLDVMRDIARRLSPEDARAVSRFFATATRPAEARPPD